MEASGNNNNTRANGRALSITGSTSKSRCWSITINNPTEEDLRLWRDITFHHWVKKAKGQLEQGEEGTPHIQGMLMTDSVRFSQVKNALPRAHIEPAKNPRALELYVTKEETRVRSLDNTLALTPRKIQTCITSLVLESLTHKGLPVIHYVDTRATIENKNKIFYRMITDWDRIHPSYQSWDGTLGQDTGPLLANLIKENEIFILDKAERFLDQAVVKLIESGTHGVEYLISNNQVRTAYKRYLPYICIRNVYEEVRTEIPPLAQEEVQ